MADDIFVLSDDDRDKIERLLKESAQHRRNPTLRRTPPVDTGDFPSACVVLTPLDGVPAMCEKTANPDSDVCGTGTGTGHGNEGDKPGSADCEVYVLQRGSSAGAEFNRPKLIATGETITVFNCTTVAVAGGQFVTAVRDGQGDWWVPSLGLQYEDCQ